LVEGHVRPQQHSLLASNPAVKKSAAQKGHSEKRCEIQLAILETFFSVLFVAVFANFIIMPHTLRSCSWWFDI